MKNRIKKMFYTSLGVFVFTPLIAFAQWDSGASAQSSAQLPTGSISGIITNIMQWLLGLVGVLGIIGFAISGIFYLTAAGNEDGMNKGKSGMVWSITGVIVALLGYVIIQAVDAMLSGSSTTF